MRQFYVVTHTQATHHVDEAVGGWYDSQLTPGGERAATTIGTRLRSLIPVGADVEIYSSDLKRAQETAALGDTSHLDAPGATPIGWP